MASKSGTCINIVNVTSFRIQVPIVLHNFSKYQWTTEDAALRTYLWESTAWPDARCSLETRQRRTGEGGGGGGVGGGFERCRKRSGKVGNVGGASEARRDEEKEEEEEEEKGRGSSRRRLVGWSGNGDVARKLGEPEESGEDEDAYVGTWMDIGVGCGWGYNKTKHDECPDVQAASTTMSGRSMVSLCRSGDHLRITWIDGFDNALVPDKFAAATFNIPNNIPVLCHRKRPRAFRRSIQMIRWYIRREISRVMKDRRNDCTAANNCFLPYTVSEDR